jgi:hypothetical protein
MLSQAAVPPALWMLIAVLVPLVAGQDNCSIGDLDLASIPLSIVGTDVVWPTPSDFDPSAAVVVINISLCSPVIVAPDNVTYCSEDGAVPPASYLIVYNMTATNNSLLPCVVAAYDALGDVSINPTNAATNFMVTFSTTQQRFGITMNASVAVDCGGVSPALHLNRDAQVLSYGSFQTLNLSLQTSAICGGPNTTSAAPSQPSESPSDTASPTPSPPPPHPMMSRISFWALVLFATGAYYAALLVSSLAVGESTNTLLLPLKLLKTLALSTYDCMCFAVGGRRPVGYAGLDFNDDEEDDIPNRPSNGIQ